jgi:uncharacterized protein
MTVVQMRLVVTITISILILVACAAQVRVGAQSSDEEPPLITALTDGNLREAKRLIAAGADVNALWGSTPLSLASYRGWEEIVRLLLSRGATVNSRDLIEDTPLMHATRGGHTHIARLLTDRGADVRAVNSNGETALYYAVASSEKENATLVRLLLDRRADPNTHASLSMDMTPLMWAARHGQQKTVDLLLSHGADVHAHDDNGYTALLHACSSPNPAILRLLLDRGADVNAKNWFGDTALSIAVRAPEAGTDLVRQRTALAAARLLLDRGAKVEARNGDGDTPLLLLVRGIVRRERLPKIQHFGSTPSQEEVRKAILPVLEILLQHGADTNARDKKGHTALELASQRGPDWLITMLTEHSKRRKPLSASVFGGSSAVTRYD